MIRLKKLFSVKDDVLPLFESFEEVKFSEENSNNIVLIGWERDGTILFRRDAVISTGSREENQTNIFLYNLREKEMKLIYHSSQLIDLIGATVNEDKTLLGYTIKVKNKDQQEEYESWIGELRENTHFTKISATTQIQRIQFVHSEGESSQQKKSYYVLLAVAGEQITLLQIPSRRSADGGVKTQAPKSLAKKLLWHEFDNVRNLLYVISIRPSKGSTAEYALKCYGFLDKRFAIFNSDEKDIAVLFELPIQIRLAANLQGNYMYPFLPQPSETQYLHIVRLNGNGTCLCQQHKPDFSCYPFGLDISIFILHMRTKIDISIPINNMDEESISRIRILFDSIGDLLVIYIPGIHFQLIECGKSLNPYQNVSISGEEFLQTLSCGISRDIIPMNFFLRKESKIQQNVLFDLKTRASFVYTFDREKIWKLFDHNKPDIHVQLLHLAMIHMQDKELVAKIISHIFSHNPQFVTEDFISEYLVGTTYLETIKQIKGRTESPMHRFLPITMLEPLIPAENVSIKRNFNKPKVSLMPGYSMIPGTKILFKEREDEKRFSYKVFSKSGGILPATASSFNSSSPGVGKFFLNLLGFDSEHNNTLKANKILQSESDEENFSRRLVAETLAFHLSTYFPKEKLTCQFVAKTFVDNQGTQANVLLSYILKSTFNENHCFQLLERFYSSLEELEFPIPREFKTMFAEKGFQCLSPQILRQYIQRGIINPNQDLVSKALESLAPPRTKQERDYMFFLIASLPKEEQSIELMKKYCVNNRSLTQHFIATVSSKRIRRIYSSHEQISYDMEEADDSPFLPLSVFFNTIKEEIPDNISFIQESECGFFSKRFQRESEQNQFNTYF